MFYTSIEGEDQSGGDWFLQEPLGFCSNVGVN